MLPTARRAVTWRTEHSPRSLVKKLDFVTASGGMFGLATPIAVFEKKNSRMALKHWHPEASLEEVIERTGFTFEHEGASPTPLPTEKEREALAFLDKDGSFEPRRQG